MTPERREYLTRKAAEYRAKKKGHVPDLEDVHTDVHFDVHTTTDQLFDERNPNYYIFGKVEHERICFQCYKKFRTRMELLKFCSPKCQKEKLSTFTTVGFKEE